MSRTVTLVLSNRLSSHESIISLNEIGLNLNEAENYYGKYLRWREQSFHGSLQIVVEWMNKRKKMCMTTCHVFVFILSEQHNMRLLTFKHK